MAGPGVKWKSGVAMRPIRSERMSAANVNAQKPSMGKMDVGDAKFVVVNSRQEIIGRFATKKAAHADGMARRRAGEDVYAHSSDTYKTFIRPRPTLKVV